MGDFDATLYFLDDREVEYLQAAVRQEYSGDLRQSVLAILFDVFEAERDSFVRGEICAVFDHLLVQFLAANQLRAVAYLLRESAQLADRLRSADPVHAQILTSLPDRVSEPATLSQLLESLEAVPELPPAEDLDALFSLLRPVALVAVLGWFARTQHPRVRMVLDQAADRMAQLNVTELVHVISAPDRLAAREAIRRVMVLRSTQAVGPLGKLLVEGDASMRLLAATALAEIGSVGALQQLERGLEDPEREIRLSSVRAIGAKAHRPALARVEAVVRSKAIRAADLSERMAFFETFGVLCGEPGVAMLDALLNGKRFLGRREDPELRACAALALGRQGGENAIASLRRAGNDKDPIVRNAVTKGLRASPWGRRS
jgi:hypothetical protein